VFLDVQTGKAMTGRTRDIWRVLLTKSAICRLIVAICAFAFVLVQASHAVQHLDVHFAASAAVSDTLTSGDEPEPVTKAPVADCCCSCTLGAPFPLAAALPEMPAAVERVAAPWSDPRPFAPSADFRPPIALI
jgi:hypothetical protein